MAKRKRLSPAVLTGQAVPDTGSETMSAPPIARVAAEAAEQSAFAEVTRALTEAREEGRLIQKLPLDQIETGHLVRDRVAFDEAEMEVLKASLAARGQQVPIEVVALEDVANGAGQRFGLISGLRRVMALRALGESQVLALIRKPETSAEAYLAMVEENEIRAGISFYERARLAAEAARLRLYDSPAAAIAALFSSASPAKRSKIGSFVRVYDELGPVLRFPAAIPERLGLALAQALETPDFALRLGQALEASAPQDAVAERTVLEAALKPPKAVPEVLSEAAPETVPEIAPGIRLEQRKGQLILSGAGVTPAFLEELGAWLQSRDA